MSGIARILMCGPEYFDIRYEINPWMRVKEGSDSERAQEQWLRLVETLREAGATIELMEPVEGLPDLVFTANAGLVYGDRFLLSRFRYEVRQRETPHFERWFESHGYRVETMPEGSYFEGAGDALFCGETLFAGYRFRSDARGLQWIGKVLGVEVLPLELVDPRFYHIDTCFCPLSEVAAIYYPGAFDSYGQSVLRARVEHLIEVPEEEAAVFCCNAAVVGRTVVVNSGAPVLKGKLEGAGFEVRVVELDEFLKAGGSAKCLTFRLDGEDAATWAQRLRKSAGSGEE